MTDVQHPVPELMKEGDVVDLLIHQHSLIRDMFDEVEHAAPGTRHEPFRQLVRMLAVHETAEEEIVHPYTRLRVDGERAWWPTASRRSARPRRCSAR
ncbi:hypothetical protein GCM10027612_46460 [Microbispora bryophytorum subsp. camponoti]